MFRHFAAATIGITMCLAMFADGEGREAMTTAIAKRQQRNTTLIAEADALGKRHVAAHDLRLRAEGRGYFQFAQEPESVEPGPPGDSYSGPPRGVPKLAPTPVSGPSGAPSLAEMPSDPRRAGLPNAPPGPRALRQPIKPRAPTAGELGKLIDASRSRSGVSPATNPGD